MHNFLLSSTVILYYIRWNPVHHMGHNRMQIVTPPVFQLSPLSSKGIKTDQYAIPWSQLYGPYFTVIQPLLPPGLFFSAILCDF